MVLTAQRHCRLIHVYLWHVSLKKQTVVFRCRITQGRFIAFFRDRHSQWGRISAFPASPQPLEFTHIFLAAVALVFWGSWDQRKCHRTLLPLGSLPQSKRIIVLLHGIAGIWKVTVVALEKIVSPLSCQQHVFLLVFQNDWHCHDKERSAMDSSW